VHAATAVDGRVEWQEHPDPTPAAGEVLVEVTAAGLNSADLMQAQGLYPPPPGAPSTLGLELAGTVAALGPATTRFAVGDRVMAVVSGGGQAELAVVHERLAMPIPDALDWPAAGGFPEVFTTAHDALFTQCGLAMGERVCVHGAAGGVGTAAVQLAAACGARIVATVRNPALRPAVAALGASVMAVAPDDFEDAGPFDVILELVGAVNLEANLRALATGGRISIIGVGAGGSGPLDLYALMIKRASIRGSTLRARPLEQKADAARRVEAHVLPLVASDTLRVPVADSFELADVAAAYARFAAGGKLGKVVLVRKG
jgi:putative PIG3 family NAD(P)H quinone oxidoreductase